jgi:hypothetical protein
MKPKVEEIFELLLAQVQNGRRVEDCLKEYPESRDELEPLLILSCQIKGLPKVVGPDPMAVESTISRVRRIVFEQREQPRPSFFKSLFTGHPVLIRVGAAVLLVLLIGWGGISFSAQSLPGHFLYPVKRLTEYARYHLTFTPDGKTELHVVFARHRTEELLKSFRPHAALNKHLLSAMLNESRAAQMRIEDLTGTRSSALTGRILEVNRRQQSTLENIRAMASAEDSAVIDQALSLCARRGECLAHGCCTQCQCDSVGCPWEFDCDWK